MKTPNDLTKEQKEMLGLFDGSKKGDTLPVDNEPLFVWGEIASRLHNPGASLYFQIWQSNDCVGHRTIKISQENMIHVFDFVWDMTSQENYMANPDLIDCLLAILECHKNEQEKLAQ